MGVLDPREGAQGPGLEARPVLGPAETLAEASLTFQREAAARVVLPGARPDHPGHGAGQRGHPGGSFASRLNPRGARSERRARRGKPWPSPSKQAKHLRRPPPPEKEGCGERGGGWMEKVCPLGVQTQAGEMGRTGKPPQVRAPEPREEKLRARGPAAWGRRGGGSERRGSRGPGGSGAEARRARGSSGRDTECGAPGSGAFISFFSQSWVSSPELRLADGDTGPGGGGSR